MLTEQYTPVAHSPSGVVLMLHGSAGLYTIHSQAEPQIDNFGEKSLARHCYVVFLPHYFQALGISSLTSRHDIDQASSKLLRTANILLDRVESLSPARSTPLFLYGESLGAYLAMSVALTRNEVRAVSEVSGGISNIHAQPARTRKLSVLISHGAQDTTVPASEALQTRRYCLQHRYPVVMDIYPGVDHYFPQQQKLRCVNRTEAFFESQKRGE